MADDKNKTQNAPKEKTKLYTLLVDVSIGGKVFKKGTKYPLLKGSADYFRTQKYIE